MLAKTATALAIVFAISSGALAANKHNAVDTNAYGQSQSIDELCRQAGPITMPAKHPICNTKDFMRW